MFRNFPRSRRLGPVLGVILGVAWLAFASNAQSASMSGQAAALPAQTNTEGQVTVTVTPLTLSGSAGSWRFEVKLNTHVAPLDQDLSQTAVLVDDNGHEQRPSAWQGDPPGGHHRRGVLVFQPIVPTPSRVTLKIGQVGSVPERLFTWTMPKP